MRFGAGCGGSWWRWEKPKIANCWNDIFLDFEEELPTAKKLIYEIDYKALFER